MRNFIFGSMAMAACLWAVPALAQPPEGADAGDGPRNPMLRQRLINAFDADGDGRLNDEELARARAALERSRGGDAAPGEGRRGPREGRGPGIGPGPGGPDAARRGPGAARGPGGRGDASPRNLEPLFAWFDANDDGMLSREEFGNMSRFVRQNWSRPGGPRGGGPRAGDRGRPFGRPTAGGPGRRGPGGPGGEERGLRGQGRGPGGEEGELGSGVMSPQEMVRMIRGGAERPTEAAEAAVPAPESAADESN